MRLVVCASLLLLLAPAPTYGDSPSSVLTGATGGSIHMSRVVCSDDNLLVHHDGTFEGGAAWEWMGVQEPYDGAFGEAFDLGPGIVECVSLWISQDGWNEGQTTDVYVWEGGVAGIPGSVLAVVPDILFENIPVWPEIGRYDTEITALVTGAVTVGSWGNWPGGMPGYWWCVDQDGPTGYPWTHVAEGIGWPPGWQNPVLIFGGEMGSMGIGVHFTAGTTPVDPATWGSIKRLFTSAR